MGTHNVKVWADAFGRWHASVPITATPRKDALKARALIQAELFERYAPNYDPSTLHVTRTHISNHGTVTYSER